MTQTAQDPATIAAAKVMLTNLIATYTPISLTATIVWLEDQIPALHTMLELLTWANAAEQVAATLPNGDLWQTALQTESYALRIRAHALPGTGSYGQ